MTVAHALAVVLLLLAAPAQARVAHAWPPSRGAPVFDQNRYQADQHRYEMDRLRIQADQRGASARWLETETRLTSLRLQSARPPEPLLPPAVLPLLSTGEARALRRAATARRQASTTSVGQIDAWLDRAPR
ncbi:hypothetical protein [Brevundimonas sp.]|uniref:hypothetical protein n=1 Tax=Brevundimonas sp. TaxID=1871086 RepID=UPI003565C3D4